MSSEEDEDEPTALGQRSNGIGPRRGPRLRSPDANQPLQARGMDASLSKMMPNDFNGRRADYKEFRIKAVFFEKLCRRR